MSFTTMFDKQEYSKSSSFSSVKGSGNGLDSHFFSNPDNRKQSRVTSEASAFI